MTRPETRLVLTSATLLFTELLLIRWIPAQLVYVGFFNNFVLIASFLGIGVGILLSRRRPDIGPWVGSIPLLALVALVFSNQLNAWIPVQRGGEVFLGFSEGRQVEVDVAVLGGVVLLVTAAMAGFALPLGPLLASMPPLRAYSFDILGSIAGVAGFAALSALDTPPLVWFALLAALLLVQTERRRPTLATALGFAALGAVIGLAVLDQVRGDLYSPYYRITVYTPENGAQAIAVNGIPHQAMWPVAQRNPTMEPYYDEVYKLLPGKRFDRALIIGAGSGTDTAVALSHDVGSVRAVEIDPEIQRIGVARHPDQPYADPRVAVTIDDGRNFLRRTTDRFDLVIFAQTDSLTLVTTTANLRLESFLFTEEAFAAARDHLAPGGVFVLYNYYREQWLVDRYSRMLDDVFGRPPLIRSFPGHAVASVVIASGQPVAAIDPAPSGWSRPSAATVAAAPRPTTDDWPLPYLRDPGVKPQYVVALTLLLVFALVLVAGSARYARVPAGSFSLHFFVLGAAFLLLETRSLVTFSLLFGTTWYVNALVIAAILASVLLAIAVQFRWRAPRAFSYAGLFGTLALAFLLPPAALLVDPPALRYLLASAIAFAPIFFANLVFTGSFRETREADAAFASNILGAMCGGVLEYAALVIGYQDLVLVVAALYVLAWLFARIRWLADRALAT